MACTPFDDGYDKYQICNEFLFVNKQMNFEDSVEYCEGHKYELAKINIKSGNADDDELRKYSSELFYNYYRIGLQFRNKDGSWFGQWLNGDSYDTTSSGEIDIFNNIVNDECYDVIINRDLKRLQRISCGRSDQFLCKKPGNRITPKTPVDKIHPPTTIVTSSSGHNYNTLTSVSNTNQAASSVLVGLSVASSILFFIAIILLTYTCYNKRKKVNCQPETEKNQNVADEIEPGYQSIDELKNNDATYMEISEYNKKKSEEDEVENDKIVTEKVQLFTSDAVYTLVNKKNKPGKSEKHGNNSNEVCNDKESDAVYTIVNKTKKEQNTHDIV